MYVICNTHYKIELALTTAEEARDENCQHGFSIEVENEIIEDRRNNETQRDVESIDDLWTFGKDSCIYNSGESRPTRTCADDDLVKRYSR